MKWILTSFFNKQNLCSFCNINIPMESKNSDGFPFVSSKCSFVIIFLDLPITSISPRKHVFFIGCLIFLPLHFRVLPFRVALNCPSLAHYSTQGLANSGHCLGWERMLSLVEGLIWCFVFLAPSCS